MAITISVQLLVMSCIQVLVAGDCQLHDTECVFHFEIKHALTMMRGRDLVFPSKGKLYRYHFPSTKMEISDAMGKWLGWGCRCSTWGILSLTFYSIDTHFDASTTDRFRKHCGKRRNCS